MKDIDPSGSINRLRRRPHCSGTLDLPPNGTGIVVNLRAWQLRSGRRPPNALSDDQIIIRWHASCFRYQRELQRAGSRRTRAGRR